MDDATATRIALVLSLSAALLLAPLGIGTVSALASEVATMDRDTVPGVIEAEDYDAGGEGVAYHDVDPANLGGAFYRPADGVDIEDGPGAGSLVIAYMRPTEWLEYTVDVTDAGAYDVTFTVASPNTGTSFRLAVDGTDAGTTVLVPNTGRWDVYTEVTKRVTLPSGRWVMRISTGGYHNLDRMEFTSIGATPTPTETPTPPETATPTETPTPTVTPTTTQIGSPSSTSIAPGIEWQQLLGGSSSDQGYSVEPTADGGYVVLAQTSSTDGDVPGTGHPVASKDLWVVKLDAAGAVEWSRLLGGSGYEYASSICQAADGGYLVLGTSDSTDGDISNTTRGGRRIWVVKLDATGAPEWDNALGRSYNDWGCSIQSTADGGCVVLGKCTEISSSGCLVTSTDYLWVLRLSGSGAVLWDGTFGAPSAHYGWAIRETADGGYVFLGGCGGSDLWVVNLDENGTLRWQRQFGGDIRGQGADLATTADGGYLLLGTTRSSVSGDASGTIRGNSDLRVVRLNSAGWIVWERVLGGSGTEIASSISPTADGGCFVLGITGSSDGDIAGPILGGEQVWVVRLDAVGGIVSQRLLGGSGPDAGESVEATADGGCILAGYTASSASGNVLGTNHGAEDVWVVKLANGLAKIAGGTGVPGDPDGDGRYDDVNGNGRKDFADVVLYFNQMRWITANEPIAAFDYNGNGRIDFADVAWLFDHLETPTARTFTVTAVAIGPGTIQPSGAFTVREGENVTFSLRVGPGVVTPHATQSGVIIGNYVVVDPAVAPTPEPTSYYGGHYPPHTFVSSYTLSDIRANHTVYGCFYEAGWMTC